MNLRGAYLETPDAPAQQLIPAKQLRIFKRIAVKPLPDSATIKQALSAIARLGGHIANNGNPGWMVLMRGYRKLLEFIELQQRFGGGVV